MRRLTVAVLCVCLTDACNLRRHAEVRTDTDDTIDMPGVDHGDGPVVTDSDTTSDTDTAVSCISGIKGTPSPAPGAADVYYRNTFVVEFITDESTTATFTLTNSAGTRVALGAPNFSDDGRSVYFNAVEPLSTNADYTLTVDYSCDHSAPIDFHTSDTGSRVGSGLFVGGSYALEPSSGTIVRPSGVASLFSALLGQATDLFVLTPKAYSSGSAGITFFGAVAASDGTQDECVTTTTLPSMASYSGNPYFELQANDGLSFMWGGVQWDMVDMAISGAFSADGARIDGLSMEGTIDTRDLGAWLGDALGSGSGPEAVCVLLGQFTAGALSCEPCPSSVGGGDYCMSLLVVGAVANLQGWTVGEISEGDVLANSNCTVLPP
jgi:hypothetical protein